MRYSVIVAPEYDFASAQVAGRIFVKSEAIELGEHELNHEIFASPVLVVTPIVPVTQPKADEPAENDGKPIEHNPFELVENKQGEMAGVLMSRALEARRKKRG